MNDKEFWIMIKRALKIIVKAIEMKYPSKDVELETGETVSLSFPPDD